MTIKALLMDFNGVVINDEPIQMRAYQEVLAAEGIVLTDAEYYECLGMDDKTFVAAAYERAGKTPEPSKILEITQAKTNHWHDVLADGVPLFEGVENFVHKMSNQFALGLVSMAKRAEIEYVLERSGLADCFSIMVTAEDVKNCKPDPECYRIGFKRLDLYRISQGHLPITHKECLVIEDSPPGVLSGKNADLAVLGVANTVSAEELRTAGASWVAKNIDDWFPESVRLAFA